MELVEEGKKLFSQSLEKLQHFLVFLGILTIIVSFITFEDGFHFPREVPIWVLLYIGIGLLILGIIVHFIPTKNIPKKLKNGIRLKFHSTVLTFVIDDLQNAKDLNTNCAFILPCNTTFIDDCVTDSNSALGAFFSKHHPNKILTFNQSVNAILNSNNIRPDENNQYKPGTAILLPEEYSVGAHVILVASVVRNNTNGFWTDPTIISKCVENVFRITTDKRITKFYFPIIGSGHGGMPLTDALNLLSICIKFHTKKYHHPKYVEVFIREKDQFKINAHFINSF